MLRVALAAHCLSQFTGDTTNKSISALRLPDIRVIAALFPHQAGRQQMAARPANPVDRG